MKNDGGCCPGSTHLGGLRRLAPVRSPEKYPDDGFKMGTGARLPAGGTGLQYHLKSPIATPRTGNSPYERPAPTKPGYGTT